MIVHKRDPRRRWLTASNSPEAYLVRQLWEHLTETNASNGDRFKFAGMQYDSTTQQYFDQARWYSSAIGRFQVLDPIGFAGADTDLYRYSANSPDEYTDPTGQSFLSDYWYYYNNPQAMDPGLRTARKAAATTALVAISVATAGSTGGMVLVASGHNFGWYCWWWHSVSKGRQCPRFYLGWGRDWGLGREYCIILGRIKQSCHPRYPKPQCSKNRATFVLSRGHPCGDGRWIAAN